MTEASKRLCSAFRSNTDAGALLKGLFKQGNIHKNEDIHTPEVVEVLKEVALKPGTTLQTRNDAIRAIGAIGSHGDDQVMKTAVGALLEIDEALPDEDRDTVNAALKMVEYADKDGYWAVMDKLTGLDESAPAAASKAPSPSA